MQLAYLLLAAPALVAATLDPATSNTKGACPSVYNCSAVKVSKAIQAAECSHNTRTSKQTFAVFETDHQYDKVKGAPYGTCSAYNCVSPTKSQMTKDADCWTFFWSGSGTSSGEGVGCIKDPQTGICGCENSDGTFVPGSSSCK
ncbi:small secreted protein [Colletotrichum truncatum]|uniref:Small secreted protein n=1 Tax=Colletotrichum truncatum TaxID=5467 RepID=A0ACC3Z6H4_COLTU|nr:small secreted protein [Colletotrichum truncatum]KAF6788066.1 small secreted protein [Colletotrichum truncatum]